MDIEYLKEQAKEYAEEHSKGKFTYIRDALYCAYLSGCEKALNIRIIN